MVERQYNHPLKILRTDNGGEYTNKTLQYYLSAHGIVHQYSCPYTPEQNGLVERKHRHILEVTRALLLTASLPHLFWPDVMLAVVHLINRLPSSTTHYQSPHQLLLNTPPSYSHLRTIGCLCFPWLRPYTVSKLSPRSLPCIFLGYAPNHKGYKCYDPITAHLYISRHVRFCESTFPYQSTSPPTSTTPPTSFPHPLTLIPPLAITNPAIPLTPHASPTLPSPIPNCATTFPSPYMPPPPEPSQAFLPDPLQQPPTLPPDPPRKTTTSHPMLTRSRTGHSKPKHLFDLSHALTHSPTPTSYSQAAKLPQWQQSMNAEFQALLSQNTWELVPHPPHHHIIGCKWVFKTKLHSNGIVACHKARLVAQGYTQTPGLDYIETFSPVAKFPTIQTLLIVVIFHKWSIFQLDISYAFLHGSLSETAYMSQPPRYRDPHHPTHVCLLKKALYGLKQSPPPVVQHLFLHPSISWFFFQQR